MIAASDPTRLWIFYALVLFGCVFVFSMVAAAGYAVGRREAEWKASSAVRRAYRRGVHDGREAHREQ